MTCDVWSGHYGPPCQLPSEMLLTPGVGPVLKGEKASSCIMDVKRVKSAMASCTSGGKELMSSTSWQRKMA